MSFSTLEIGKKALIAQRFGLDITSNNIANVNTEGYSRRQATFSEAAPNYRYGQFKGQGVLVNKLRSFREEFFDREIRNTLSRKAGLESDDIILQRIETVLAEPSDSNLNESVTEFLTQFEEVALKPESVGLREHLIELGRTVADKFNYMTGVLLDSRTEAARDLNSFVSEANDYIAQIAELNHAFSAGQSLSQNESQTMIDERERILEDLSELGDLAVTQNDDGSVNVFMNGINLVTKNVGSTLAVEENLNDATGEITLRLIKQDSSGNTLNTITPQSGKLASNLFHHNVTLDGKDSSGGFSAVTRLNNYAEALVNKVNGLTQTGYGLDDTDPEPPARNFFEIDEDGDAGFSIRISENIDGNPRDIPLSGNPDAPGDQTVARQIARLTEDVNFIGNESYVEYYSAFVGKLGAARQNVANELETINVVSDQLENQRESVIGVNMDEEAINLVKFQRAFDAASRVISTTNEMLQTIINLGR